MFIKDTHWRYLDTVSLVLCLNSMLRRDFSETNSPPASQEIIRLVWNTKFNNSASDECDVLHCVVIF